MKARESRSARSRECRVPSRVSRVSNRSGLVVHGRGDARDGATRVVLVVVDVVVDVVVAAVFDARVDEGSDVRAQRRDLSMRRVDGVDERAHVSLKRVVPLVNHGVNSSKDGGAEDAERRWIVGRDRCLLFLFLFLFRRRRDDSRLRQ